MKPKEIVSDAPKASTRLLQRAVEQANLLLQTVRRLEEAAEAEGDGEMKEKAELFRLNLQKFKRWTATPAMKRRRRPLIEDLEQD